MDAPRIPFPAGIPGYADLQVNGYVGVGFTSPELSADGFKRAVAACHA